MTSPVMTTCDLRYTRHDDIKFCRCHRVTANRMTRCVFLFQIFLCSTFANGDILRSSHLVQKTSRTRASPSILLLSSSHPACSDSESGVPGSHLSASQLRMCQLYPDHMDTIRRGARMALAECQFQLQWRRWNCSVAAEDPSLFGMSVDSAANRETAFVQALTSAGVVNAISRACREGELTSCGCSSRRHHQQHDNSPESPTPSSVAVIDAGAPSRRRAVKRTNQRRPRQVPVDDEWQWGGCGDNVDYGYRFAVGFVDARHKEKNYPRHSLGLSRMLAALHNNEAGRLAVYNYATVACKCHGVSGSCTVKTCWHQLPAFREIGDRLLAMYDMATEVAFNRHGTYLQAPSPNGVEDHRLAPSDENSPHLSTATSRVDGRKSKKKRKRGDGGRRPSKDELVFVERSPDYCGPNVVNAVSETAVGGAPSEEGYLGTRGRRCRRTVPVTVGGTSSSLQSTPLDSCDVLCCGRGFNAYRETITERCRCRFVWCCHVTCSTCERDEDVHVCK